MPPHSSWERLYAKIKGDISFEVRELTEMETLVDLKRSIVRKKLRRKQITDRSVSKIENGEIHISFGQVKKVAYEEYPRHKDVDTPPKLFSGFIAGKGIFFLKEFLLKVCGSDGLTAKWSNVRVLFAWPVNYEGKIRMGFILKYYFFNKS